MIEALDHQRAHSVGEAKPNSRLCKCCGYQIERSQIKLCSQIEDLSFLGFGYPLYFAYMKYAIILIMIQFITVGQFMLIANYKSVIWLAYPTKKVQEIQDVLSFTATLFMIGFMIYFRAQQAKLEAFCDIKTHTPADYTILVKGLPRNSHKEELEELIRQNLDNVAKVCFIYSNTGIVPNSNVKRQSMNILQETYFDQNLFSGSALVSFNLKKQKEDILNSATFSVFHKWLKLILHLDFSNDGKIKFGDGEIQIRQAPEPTDINWKDINGWIEQSSFVKTIDIIFNWMLLIALLVLACFDEIKTGKDRNIWALIVVPFLTIFNFYILPRLPKYIIARKHFSWTQKIKNKSEKYTYILTMLSILCIYFFQGEVFWLLLCNSLLPPIMISIQLKYYYKQYKIKYKSEDLNQEQLNKLYELPYHKIWRNQSFLTSVLILTFFYGFYMPIGQIISLLGLTLFFWADKYIILRYSSIKHQPSPLLSQSNYKISQFIPLIYSCQHYLRSDDVVIPIIQLVFAIVFNIIPTDLLSSLIWLQPNTTESQEYSSVQFQEEYDRVNPAIQYGAVSLFLSQKKKMTKYVSLQILATKNTKLKQKTKNQISKQLQKVEHQIRQLEIKLEKREKNLISDQSHFSEV